MMLRRFLPATSILLLAIYPAQSEGGAETITGRASIIDGDTIEIAGERIRLHGIDAPESWQICEDGDGAVTTAAARKRHLPWIDFWPSLALPAANTSSAIDTTGSWVSAFARMART